MKKPAILILLFNIVFTQGYVRDVSPFTVTFDGEEIFQPFSGGLNQPDPRFIDWNGDGTLDCFINDRDGCNRPERSRKTAAAPCRKPVCLLVDGRGASPCFDETTGV